MRRMNKMTSEHITAFILRVRVADNHQILNEKQHQILNVKKVDLKWKVITS